MEKLTKSIEDYLEAILMIEEEGSTVHSARVAEILGISRPAVTKQMDVLIAQGYATREPYSEIKLTEKGREIAIKVYDRHKTLRQFLINLGVSEETAEKDCCLIEHVISEETFLLIKEQVNKDNK